MGGGFFNMIFVTLGTQDKSFKRLLAEIDTLIEKNIITDKVIVQAGFTNYCSKNMKVFDYISMEEFNQYIQHCHLLITHGGVGSILTGCLANKKVLAVARLSKYDEHENNHQLQIVEEFAKQGYIIGCSDVSELEYSFQNLKSFSPKKYKSNNHNFCNIITDFIDTLN